MVRVDISTEDNANDNVPDTFLGTIGLVTDDKGAIVINPEYRSDNTEFHYYINRIMAAINPTCSKFSQRKCRDLISEIYSITDEAFGLLVIYNEHQVWMDQEEMKMNGDKGKMIKKRKRFCSGNSGSKQGWSDTGLDLFNSLCHQIKERQEKTVEFETLIRQKFVTESNRTRGAARKKTPNDQTSSVLRKSNYCF